MEALFLHYPAILYDAPTGEDVPDRLPLEGRGRYSQAVELVTAGHEALERDEHPVHEAQRPRG
jgi:hypothetical protein